MWTVERYSSNCLAAVWMDFVEREKACLARLMSIPNVLGRPILQLLSNTVPVSTNFLCHAPIEEVMGISFMLGFAEFALPISSQ